jgi:hypothetical protein
LVRSGSAPRPYRRLLEIAGCAPGDLEALVLREGVEGALEQLYRAGVYLTLDEFKGRCPVVRGGVTVEADPHRLRNPLSAPHLSGQTGGSRGASTPVTMDLGYLADVAVNRRLALEARGATDWEVAYWDVPGGVLRPLLVYAKVGVVAYRWFSPVDLHAPGLHHRYRWSVRTLRWGGRLAGVSLPAPEHVPVDAPLPIVRWMASTLRAGKTPLLFTYSSPAVRLCQAARDAGIDLRGAQFSLYGEPITDARLAVIRGAGAVAQPLYVTTECSRIARDASNPRRRTTCISPTISMG